MTDVMDGESPFPTAYDTAPPVPIEAAGQIARSAIDGHPGGPVSRRARGRCRRVDGRQGGVECPQWESNGFLHPESIIPHNTVQYSECSFAAFGYAWWEDRALADFA